MKTTLKKYSLIYFLIILVPVSLICLCFGSIFISPLKLFSFNTNSLFILEPSSSIVSLRLVRILTAFIVGGGLAVSGAAYQAVLRNPLAEPYILGISGGASLGAAISIATGLQAMTYLAVPLSSFIGAIIILATVLMMSRGAGMEYSNNVMLSGVIAGVLCSSILMFIISVLDVNTLHSVSWWMLGCLQAEDYKLLGIGCVVILTGTLTLFFYAREANVISLGEEMAYYLGIPPRRSALIILGTASFMTASAVALSGIIGFVGLIIPHILRKLFGADHRKMFPLALVSGGLFLMVCDTFARSILKFQEIPVGVITAFIGGPFFLWLLNKKTLSKVL